MAEPHNPSPLLQAGFLVGAVAWEEGRELADRIATETNPDRLADLMEQAIDSKDVSHVVIMTLALRLRGVPDPGSMIEVRQQPARLELPHG